MSFDTLAPFYRNLEQVFAGRKMQRCRTAHLDAIPVPGSILLAGEGPGRFLATCRERFPSADITCVDLSARMIDLARRGAGTAAAEDSRVRFVQADLLSWTPPAKPFDLIVTHFFLDCFREDQLEGLIARLAGAAAPEAGWLVADFQIAPHGWRRWRSRLIVASLYAFFRATTGLSAKSLASPGPFLERAGFRLERRVEHDHSLLRSDWWRRP